MKEQKAWPRTPFRSSSLKTSSPNPEAGSLFPSTRRTPAGGVSRRQSCFESGKFCLGRSKCSSASARGPCRASCRHSERLGNRRHWLSRQRGASSPRAEPPSGCRGSGFQGHRVQVRLAREGSEVRPDAKESSCHNACTHAVPLPSLKSFPHSSEPRSSCRFFLSLRNATGLHFRRLTSVFASSARVKAREGNQLRLLRSAAVEQKVLVHRRLR